MRLSLAVEASGVSQNVPATNPGPKLVRGAGGEVVMPPSRAAEPPAASQKTTPVARPTAATLKPTVAMAPSRDTASMSGRDPTTQAFPTHSPSRRDLSRSVRPPKTAPIAVAATATPNDTRAGARLCVATVACSDAAAGGPARGRAEGSAAMGGGESGKSRRTSTVSPAGTDTSTSTGPSTAGVPG